MKRIISIMLCLITLLSMSIISYADEDFTLRNGIKFGDTIDVIREKETTLIPEELQGKSGHYETGNWYIGEIAGYSNSRCKFICSKETGLIEMHYDFSNNCTSLDRTNDIYDNLYTHLVRQYGKPLGYKDGSMYIITGSATHHMWDSSLLVSAYKYFGKTGECDMLDYAEWVVDANDYHVKIDLISSYFITSDDTVELYVDLSYKMFTDAEYEEALAKNQARENEINDDL